MDIENYVPTVESEQDKVHRVIRAAIGLSPVASGAMLEAFHLLWQPPAEARAEKWVVDVISKLNSLAERIDDLEQAIVSEEFQSLLIAANQLVIKHHQAEKIEYFVNSIASSITAQSLTYDKKYAYLLMLDGFTLLHIRVLRILKNAIYWGTDTETTESRFSHYVTSEIIKLDPELASEMQLVQKVVQDLERNNLFFEFKLLFNPETKIIRSGVITNTDAGTIGLKIPIEKIPNKKHVYESKLNNFGREFLDFIENTLQ